MRWGIISTGVIAHKFAGTVLLMQAEGEQLLAVSSRSGAKAKAFAGEYNIPDAYGSLEEMLKNPQVDAVYVAAPNTMHFETARKSLEAGKHVLCEKPFTINAGQARKLYALARERGLFIMEAFWIRFLPLLIEMRKVIASGEIGDIVHVRSDYGFIASGDRKEDKLSARLGAGALMDIGIYNLGFTHMVMDAAPVRFQSAMRKSQFGSDEFSAILLEYPGSRSASLATSIGMDMPRNAAVFGTRGEIVFPDFQIAQEMTIRLYDGETRTVQMPFDFNGFEYEIREVNRCVKLGLTSSDILRETDTLTVLGAMDAIRASWDIRFPGEN
ncbi:MAG: Gfo/Idh/MocA family oxidoreductase [Eubacteriales bacterium]|nr:Gfo/Idh/MocA family oxidoreductase [Eubacteriales bacterium]